MLNSFLLRGTCAIVLVGAFSSHSIAQLTAYYTLDDLGGGITNMGTDGATSNLTASGGTISVLGDGIIGPGALNFDGASVLSAQGAGNAADDLTGYPFTMSIWLRNGVNDGTRDAVMSASDISAGSTYYNVGVGTNDAGNEAEMVIRNTGFTEVDATGSDIDGNWHNVVAVFDTGNAQQIYFDGKLSNTGTLSGTFSGNVDTFSIGAFLRNGGTITDPYTGDADDAGLFTTALNAADAALINGLGQVGGIGLDQFDEAQALAMASLGTESEIGGFMFERVDGLGGVTGDFGGTTSGGDAFIVLNDQGGGIQQVVQAVPEPASVGIWCVLGLGLAGFGYCRVRRKK